MNRRTALSLSLLSGWLLPGRLLAQAAGRRDGTRGTRLAQRPEDNLLPDPEPPPARPGPEPEPGGVGASPDDPPQEPGHRWRRFPIASYTALAQNQAVNPQAAIIEWIFRRTRSDTWHGAKASVLCADRAELRAYHDPAVLDQVGEMVDRFLDPVADVLTIRVRVFAAADPRWRYAVHQRLNPLEGGPQGQQIWTAKVEDAAMVVAQMGVAQGFKALADREFRVVNGQTVTTSTTAGPRDYVADLQRASAVGLGYQPGTKQLSEGVVLRLSPLLTWEGDTLEAAIDLRVSTIKKLHATKVIAPREIGPTEMTIEVPEVTESRLNQTVVGWALDRTLIISAGIQPGILQAKGGPFNLRLPGTVPTGTELLVLLDAKTAAAPGRSRRVRD